MIAAGGNSLRGKGGSAKDCLAAEARPITPPEIRKYRRSTNLEPGKRFVHYGVADDLEQMNLQTKVFGAYTERGTNTAADAINHSRSSELERINQLKAERVYKTATREILGKTVDRGNVLPSKFTEGGAPFGTGSRASEVPAKDVIFPAFNEDSLKGEDIYIRSHGSYGPGAQKNRNYNWPVNPNETRFGERGDTIAFNGVSKNINDILKYTDEKPSALNIKKVEDRRNMGDILGQSRNLGQGSGERPTEIVYGKPSTNPHRTHWSAGEIIRGKYSAEDQVSDNDLGRSIMPGFRNIAVEDRVFGCPSIRTDLPVGTRRSLADSQNYGDDVTARDLINPPAFSELNVPQGSTEAPRSKEALNTFFAKIGYRLRPEVVDALFDEASRDGRSASITAYRHCLNRYLEAVDTNNEAAWRRERGI